MRMTFTIIGAFTDWIPFGSPVHLQSDVTGALTREGWTVIAIAFTEQRDPLSALVEYDGAVTVDTQSVNIERVRLRLSVIMEQITSHATIVTSGRTERPSVTRAIEARTQSSGWTLPIALVVVGLIAVAIILMKVRP